LTIKSVPNPGNDSPAVFLQKCGHRLTYSIEE
jgi:hypothetical protein